MPEREQNGAAHEPSDVARPSDVRSSADAAALTVGGEACEERASSVSRPQLAAKTKAGIAVLALASALLIVVAAFALSTGSSAKVDTDAASSATVTVQATESDDSERDSPSRPDDAKPPESAEETGTSDGADQATEPQNGGFDSSASSGAEGGLADGASAPVGGSSSASAPSASSAAADNSGSQSSSSSTNQPAASVVDVTVSVDSSAAGGGVSASASFSFGPGATPYDALCALGLSVNARSTGYGTYVAAIGGLAEKEHGGQSGWMYSVNGTTPMTACSNYVLSDGDVVLWYYVTG